jgi:hypothetical protein
MLTERAQKHITGRWEVSLIESSQKPGEPYVKDFQAMLRTMLINAIIEFKPDLTFSSKIGDKEFNGTWINTTNKSITLQENKLTTIYNIISLTEVDLILQTEKDSYKYTVMLRR